MAMEFNVRQRGAFTSRAKAAAWETLEPLLNSMYQEFSELSKKKPEGAVSLQKIKMVNRLLTRCLEVLVSEPANEFLDLLDQDEVPQNSDVTLMLSQFLAAMKHFRQTYYRRDSGRLEQEWVTVEEGEGAGNQPPGEEQA